MILSNLVNGLVLSTGYVLITLVCLAFSLLVADAIAALFGFDVFAEGTKIYWQLMRSKITCATIAAQRSSIIAAYLFELYGFEKYINTCPSHNLDIITDLYGSVFIVSYNNRTETAVYVKVKNSTSEPDGSFKNYYIRVPPYISDPLEGVAWTFDLLPSEYKPLVET